MTWAFPYWGRGGLPTWEFFPLNTVFILKASLTAYSICHDQCDEAAAEKNSRIADEQQDEDKDLMCIAAK